MYKTGNATNKVKKALSNDFRIIEEWFHKNVMVLRSKKCYYMYFRNSSQNDHFIFNGIKLPNSFEEKVLIIIIDNELEFEPHIRNICKKQHRN